MIVFPMAGKSSRFKTKGIDTPKYFLPLYNQTVFHWVVKSFSSFKEEFNLFVLGPHNYSDKEMIEKELRNLKLKKFEIVVLSEGTDGQASTVFKGLENSRILKNNHVEPVLIFNIDTIRPNFRCLDYGQDNCWIETFEGEGDHWSFVVPNGQGSRKASQIVEKQRVSNLCCTGAYYFPTVSTYKSLYLENECRRSNFSEEVSLSENFVSNILQLGIERELHTTFDIVDKKYVLASGTPAEYEVLSRSDFSQLFYE